MSSSAEIVHLAQTELDRPLTAAEIRAGVNLIQEVMRSVMTEGVHYGKIPGTPKKSLWKPGAEKILVTFRIGTSPIVEDLSTIDEARYRVTVIAKSHAHGMELGASVGECSSNEEKYKWRKAICKEEFEETPEDRRRNVWKRGEKGVYQIQQVRTNHADVANTILKMAVKRAKVAVTLDVTAASDVFDQDIEDLPEELQRELAGEHEQQASRFNEPKSAAPAPEPAAQNGNGHKPGMYVKAARVAKTGKTDKGEWKLHLVTLSNGEDYTTFSESLYESAKKLMVAKVPVTFEFEEQNGKKNLVLIEAV